jgi:hypothetical protein
MVSCNLTSEGVWHRTETNTELWENIIQYLVISSKHYNHNEEIRMNITTRLQVAHQIPKLIKTFIILHAMLYDVAPHLDIIWHFNILIFIYIDSLTFIYFIIL